jgi:hypothetical protein
MAEMATPRIVSTGQFGGAFATPTRVVWVEDNNAAASSPRALLDSAINSSRAQAAAGVGSAQSGVQAILGQKPLVDRTIGDMRGAADAMVPIADELRGYGDAMWESGTKVTQQALDTLATGMGFIDMDESASPLVAEALRLYGQVDPDRYVATAAQDVQSAFDNQRGQNERRLARMGVNPSSGAAQALNQLYDRSLAVARAAAMQRAREQGRAEQRSAFQDLVTGNAQKFLQTGGQLASIGASGQQAAVGAQKGAADVLGGAADIYGGAANLGLNFGKALSGAYNALAGIQLDEARNTNATESLRVNALKGGGGGGVNVIDNTDKAIVARLAAGAKDPIARF